MSNAPITSRTILVAVRLPREIHATLPKGRGEVTPYILEALRAKPRLEESCATLGEACRDMAAEVLRLRATLRRIATDPAIRSLAAAREAARDALGGDDNG